MLRLDQDFTVYQIIGGSMKHLQLGFTHSKFAVILFSIFATTGCASLSSPAHEGENLVTPYHRALNTWNTYVKHDEFKISHLWHHPDRGIADTYIVNVSTVPEQEIDQFRDSADQRGRDRCDRFRSVNLAYSSVNRYPGVFWRTQCENLNGRNVQVLNLAIKGSDSFYHVQKIWRYDIEERELDQWIERVQQTFVCDTRRADLPCRLSDY